MYTIYKVKNKINDKIYIGFSKNFEQRIKYHKYFSLTKKSNFAFHKAIRKYGWDNFSWEIIYESWDKEHCSEVMEPFFITEYNSFGNYGYNMTIGGRGAKELKRSPLTEEQKKIISEKTKLGMQNMSQEDKERMLSITTNPSEETRQKMSQAKKGKESTFKGKSQSDYAKEQVSIYSKARWENEETRSRILKHIQNPSEETRRKMSEAKKGKPSWNIGLVGNSKKSIEVLDSNYKRIGILNGNKDIKNYGFTPGNVYNTINGRQKHHKGYFFRYMEEKHESYLDTKVV